MTEPVGQSDRSPDAWVWTVHRGYEADLIAVCSTENRARAIIRDVEEDTGLFSHHIVFADEWTVDGTPTGRKITSHYLEED